MPKKRNLCQATVEVHLYGKLRRAGGSQDPTKDCVLEVRDITKDTVMGLIDRLGFTLEDLGLVFLNGHLADLNASVKAGDRLGLFPSDQRLLYKWYFPKVEGRR